MLGHGSFSSIRFLTTDHWANVIPPNFIRTSPNSFFVVLRLRLLLLLKGSHHIRQFLFLLQGALQLLLQHIVLISQPSYLIGIKLQSLLDISLKFGKRYRLGLINLRQLVHRKTFLTTLTNQLKTTSLHLVIIINCL